MMYMYLRLKFRIINYCFFQLFKNQRSNGKYGRLIGAGDFQANSREFSVCLGLTRLVFYPTRLKYGKFKSKKCANFLRYNHRHSYFCMDGALALGLHLVNNIKHENSFH